MKVNEVNSLCMIIQKYFLDLDNRLSLVGSQFVLIKRIKQRRPPTHLGGTQYTLV